LGRFNEVLWIDFISQFRKYSGHVSEVAAAADITYQVQRGSLRSSDAHGAGLSLDFDGRSIGDTPFQEEPNSGTTSDGGTKDGIGHYLKFLGLLMCCPVQRCGC